MFEFLGSRRRLEARVAQLEHALLDQRPPPIYLGSHTAMGVLARTGQKIFVDTRDRSMVPHILHDGLWEDWVVGAFLAETRPGMTVLDVGASFGCFALPAAAAVGSGGRVFAVEANPIVVEHLRNSARANGLAHMNVVAAAASNVSGTAKLNTSLAASGHASVIRRRDADDGVFHDVEVPAERLDVLLPANTRVDVMKIDVEDGEYQAFQGMGALLDGPRVIFCEFLATGVARFEPPLDYLESFRRRGFGIHVAAPGGVTTALTPAAVLARIGDNIENLVFKR